jgi:hypothetical protein
MQVKGTPVKVVGLVGLEVRLALSSDPPDPTVVYLVLD